MLPQHGRVITAGGHPGRATGRASRNGEHDRGYSEHGRNGTGALSQYLTNPDAESVIKSHGRRKLVGSKPS